MKSARRFPAAFALVLLLVQALWPAQAHAQQATAAPYAVPRFRHADPLAKPPDLQGLPTIRFLADEDFPPFSYRDSSGALTGFSIAMANALCEELKLTCQFIAKPYEALLPALQKGEADVLVAGFRLSPDLLEKASFTKPYYRSLARFAVAANDPLGRADARSLAGKRIGVIAGTRHEAWLKTNITKASLRGYPDLGSAGKALKDREVDALFADAAALIFWTHAPVSDNCCRLADGAFADADSLSPGMSLLVRQKDPRLLNALDYGLDRLEATGVQAVVFRRFFPGKPMVKLLQTGPENGSRFLFAHGAGAPMDSSYMELMAGLLADEGVRVIRFEFDYMAQRRAGPKRPPPPNMSKILNEFRTVIGALPEGQLAIGGKSMGGRAASLIADEMQAQGRVQKLVLFGYPFHPPSKPEHLRTEHLKKLTCPTLLLQGERDPFGTKDEVEAYGLSPVIRMHWLGDGDHDLKPRVASGFTWKANMAEAAKAAAAFIRA